MRKGGNTTYTITIGENNEADTYREQTKEQVHYVLLNRFGWSWGQNCWLMHLSKAFDTPITLERHKLRIECHKPS